MRICMISEEYPPDTGFGGIGTFTHHLAHGLKDLGHEVEVVSLTKAGKRGLHYEPAKLTTNAGIPIHRVPVYSFPGELGVLSFELPYSRHMLRATTALWAKFLELHMQRPFDVVDTPELMAVGIYPAITRLTPMTIRLYTPHSKFIHERLHNVSPTFDHLFVAMTERLALMSSDVITSPSNNLARYIAEDLNYPLDKIQIVRNPIDTDLFNPEGEQALPATRSPKVLFVGRLEERKGITYLIRAIPRILQSCPDTRFYIVGNDTTTVAGNKSQLADLKATLRQQGCGSSVTFIPRVPLSTLPAYYRSADVCVVPSVYDNSPYTCLEAMSCGRAVVGTTAGGTQEYLTHGQCGLIIPPKDPDAIATAVIDLLNDSDKRHRFGINARHRVLENFSRQEIARQTLEVYSLAQTRFQQRQPWMYLKSPDAALLDSVTFFDGYDKQLYDMLYKFSLTFRLRHWIRLGLKRPRLFTAKLLAMVAKLSFSPAGRRLNAVDRLIAQLEEHIKQKERPRSQQPLLTESGTQSRSD